MLNQVEFSVFRDTFIPPTKGMEGATLGKVFYAETFLGHTLEDEDRRLETTGTEAKVYGKTAIPCGRYRLTIVDSKHFGKPMLQLLGVPGFSGIRIHGANDASQLEGCIAVGEARTGAGVCSCAPVVTRIFRLVQEAEQAGRECWITIARQCD